MLNHQDLSSYFTQFNHQQPFSYCVVDNFFTEEHAKLLSSEFPDFEDSTWHEYKNKIEIKKACNNWNLFPKATYETFSFLNSKVFLEPLMKYTQLPVLLPDHGLNGGGWHIHASGGKLNPHLDYSMHPKLPYQRKINLIVYLQEDWVPEWGGHLGLYEHNSDTQAPGECIHEIEPKFNRALFFDTTMNSWHGLCKEVTTPKGICRKSIATYYLTIPPKGVDQRGKALFAPTQEQQNDADVLQLIKKRSSLSDASSTYK